MINQYFVWSCAVLLCAGAAPPGSPMLTTPHIPQPAQYNTQQFRGAPYPLEYLLDNPTPGFYNNIQHKQGASDTRERLETLEPDSEVELIPGAAQPQQPPQQNPVSPTIPGLLPGQRVFIIHPMAILPNAYRPGMPGGYQPVYIVAAAPNPGHYASPAFTGYQNTILLDPSGQSYAYPAVTRGAAPAQPQQAAAAGPLAYQRQPAFLYPSPESGFVYRGSPGGDINGAVHLAQLVSLQNAAPVKRPLSQEHSKPSEQQRIGEGSETGEASEANASDETSHPASASRTNPQVRSKPKP